MEGPLKGKIVNPQPFYLAPQRLTLQTPCEIIREARADIMGGRDGRGLRPVQTSRPFTPKERGRVLFGPARRGARPPSAVNLSYLQKADTSGATVKLPMIPSRGNLRAATSRNPPRTVLSLDNLVEEVEAESGFAGHVRNGVDELPGLRKSYSSPQERATVITPDLPLNIILRDRWTSEPSAFSRQNSELQVQKKKIHRLQSLSTFGNNVEFSSGPTNPGMALLNDENPSVVDETEKELRHETVKNQPAVRRVINNIVETRTSNSTVPANSTTSTEWIQLPQAEEETEEKMKGEQSQNTEDSLIAVLSEGKLTWEPSPKNNQEKHETAQHSTEAVVPLSFQENSNMISEPGAPTNCHLQNMKNNLNQVHGKMQDLHAQIEKLGTRVAIGRAQKAANNNNVAFHMNNNIRYHTTTKANVDRSADSGVKAYQKFSENIKSEEEEVVASATSQDNAGWDFFWKNSYFRIKEEALRPELESLAKVLEELRVMHGEDVDVIEVENRLDTLYTKLKDEDGFSQGGVPTAFKSKLLQTLYMYADDDRPKLLLLIARLVLALRVESGLPAACKMVFKVARSDVNDNLFIDVPDILELFLDGIGRASPLDAQESCIYGYGALKFLTVNSMLLAHALHLGALDLVTLHLKIVNNAQQDGEKIGEQTQHAIFQLTGALRNIADGDGIGPLFLTTNCVPTLVKTLLVFRSDEEIVSNIARTLSSLSSDEDTVQVLLTVDDLAINLVDLLKQYQHQDQILTRLGYALGNVLACSDLARVQLSRYESCLPTLLCVLEFYLEKEASTTEEKESIDDVVVKIIRVVANMCMNPVVGSHLSILAAQDGQLAGLLRVLVARTHGSVLLAALGCLNNLSYYVHAQACLLELTRGVLSVLETQGSAPSQDCAVEACRVLGNLTRHKQTRDLIFSQGGLETLERVLESGSAPGSAMVARSVCGVLVNMLLDQNTRHAYLQHRGIDKLVTVIERFPGDWQLAGLVCRAIWNACAPDLALAFSSNNIDNLLTTLANCLEEENWDDGNSEWEEFAGIATDLLEKFNAHIESTH